MAKRKEQTPAQKLGFSDTSGAIITLAHWGWDATRIVKTLDLKVKDLPDSPNYMPDLQELKRQARLIARYNAVGRNGGQTG